MDSSRPALLVAVTVVLGATLLCGTLASTATASPVAGNATTTAQSSPALAGTSLDSTGPVLPAVRTANAGADQPGAVHAQDVRGGREPDRLPTRLINAAGYGVTSLAYVNWGISWWPAPHWWIIASTSQVLGGIVFYACVRYAPWWAASACDYLNRLAQRLTSWAPGGIWIEVYIGYIRYGVY